MGDPVTKKWERRIMDSGKEMKACTNKNAVNFFKLEELPQVPFLNPADEQRHSNVDG